MLDIEEILIVLYKLSLYPYLFDVYGSLKSISLSYILLKDP